MTDINTNRSILNHLERESGGRGSEFHQSVAQDVNTNLNGYCQAVINMLANQVPDVQTYVTHLEDEQHNSPPYESLLGIIEFMITLLPDKSHTLKMVRNLQQQVLQSKRDLKVINKNYITVQAEKALMRT